MTKPSHQDRLKIALEFYTQAAPVFHEKTKQWQGVPYLDSFIEMLPESELPVVDLACGVGRDVEYLYRNGVSAYGIDASAAMLAVAREKFPECKYELGDVTRKNLGIKTHRGVWAASMFQVVAHEDFEEFITKASDALISGGLFYANYRLGQTDVPFKSGDYGEPTLRLMSLYDTERVGVTLDDAGLQILSHVPYTRKKHGNFQHKARVYARKR